MLHFAAKGFSVARGLASEASRVDSARRLLGYFLGRLTRKQQAEHLLFAPRLPDEAFAGSRLYPDRTAMLDALPKGGIVAEVGVYEGEFTREIAGICRPDRMVVVDIDFSRFQEPSCPVEKLEGDSSAILSRMPAEHFDWLYIDADHSYESVRKDLAAAHRCLKPGGYLMCNDYTVWCVRSAEPYGVPKAVNELVIEHGYQVRGLALDTAGMYDVLIQKP